LGLGLRHVPSGLALKAQIVIEAAKPEFTFTLIGEGALSGPARYPSRLIACGGHGIGVAL
jgi:hypothetical protein